VKIHRWVWIVMVTIGWAAGPVESQTRTITGRITDAVTAQPLSGVQVALPDTRQGTFSRADGTFTIEAPAGEARLRIRLIGYRQLDVVVGAGESNIQVSLQTDVLNLDAIVVTGQATGVSRRNLANSIATVSGDEVDRVPSPTIEQALQGKIAGAQIQTNTGAPGGGNRVRLRGITSLIGAATPLWVVDGVIVSDVQIAPGTNRVSRASGATAIAVVSQEAPVNRIADLNPNDIESIEVLKGAAASAIYGSKASAGVIMITTRRGQAGRTRMSARQGFGTARLSYVEGSRHFKTLDDAISVFGPGVAAYYDPDRQLSYERLIAGESPLNYETSLSASGGTEATRFFVSGLVKHDGGIVRNTFADKQTFRVNLDHFFTPTLKIGLNNEVLHSESDRSLFGNENSGAGVWYTMTKIPSFLDLRRREDGSFPENPFGRSNPLQTIDLFQNREEVWRVLSSARADFDVLQTRTHSIRMLAVTGLDLFSQKNTIFSPPDLQFEPDDGLPGTSVLSFSQNLNLNVNLNAVHSFTPVGGLFTATTSIGSQYETRDLNVSRTSSQGLLGGLQNVRTGVSIAADQDRTRVVDFGFFAQEEVLFRDRLLLTAGVRADRSSNNGDTNRLYLYPKAAASYRMPALIPGFVDELKLRSAYGQAGNQPVYGQKFTTLNTQVIGGVGGFQLLPTAGAADIRPERQAELEAGLDATLMGDRAILEVTAFNRNITDLLLQRTLAPSTGFGSEIFNGGEMRVRGLEIATTVNALQGPTFTWSSRLNFALNRSTITELPVPSFLFSTPTVGAVRIEQGKSATQLIGNDTLPGGREVVPVVIGDGNPSYNAGFSSDVGFKGLRLYALLDRQKGGMLAAGTWRHFDLGQNAPDHDELLPNGRKAGADRVQWYRQVTRVYYQDASYYKLREVTIGYDIPRSVRDRLWAVDNARVNLSGRNLYTWTNYRGGDPDFANFGQGNDNLQRNRELAAYPPSRSFWFTIDLSF